MNHKLQDEVGDVAEELRHVQRELEARNNKVRHKTTNRLFLFFMKRARSASSQRPRQTRQNLKPPLSLCFVSLCLVCVPIVREPEAARGPPGGGAGGHGGTGRGHQAPDGTAHTKVVRGREIVPIFIIYADIHVFYLYKDEHLIRCII